MSSTPPSTSPYAAIRESISQYKRQNVEGDTFVLVEPLTRALEAQYHDLDNTLYHVVLEAHEELSPEPLDIEPVDLPSMRRILYSLLDLEHPELLPLFHPFKDDHLPIFEEDLHAKLEAQALEKKFSKSYRAFPTLWLRHQPSWCPFVFELSRRHLKVRPQCIVPFYKKRELKPYEGGQEPRDGRAKLYEVHIPAELVKLSMLEPSQLPRCNDLDRTYWRFALKEFPESLKQSWDKENQTFRAIGPQSGMISYYGCYELETGDRRHAFGILLEFADYDLNGTISEEEPPVTPDEIKSFYDSMQELAVTLSNIHRLVIWGQKYDFWHGDIKPENILRVERHFKLADPGDSWIQRAPEDGKRKAKAEVDVGTRTYASPEKARSLENADEDLPDKIFQNADVWSLGCVFSIAATYVVLGEQGVKLYSRVRMHAHAKLATGLIQNVFHANGAVLDVVAAWHSYLRLVARRGDVFTATVLDMVDNHMLVMPPEQRWEAEQVAEHFSELLAGPTLGNQEVPEVIGETLRELVLMAELYQESERGVKRLDSDIAKMRFRQEETEARTTTRSRFKKISLSPVAPSSLWSPQAYTAGRFGAMGSYALAAAGFTGGAREPEIFTSIFQMKEELEALGRDRSLGPLKALLDRKARRKSVKGEIADDFLLPFYKDRDLVFLVDNGSSMESHWAEVKFVLEVLVWRVLGYDSDGIELFFTDPDTKARVGPSKKQTVELFLDAMRDARPTSTSAKTELRPGLRDIMLTYSKTRNPMTIFILTDGEWRGMPYEHDIEVWAIQYLCELARQGINTLPSPTRESSGGLWQLDFEKSRPITLQFVAFGHSTVGKRRMKRLDDIMSQEHGLPDIIDMEPSTGDACKMLLGSLIPQWDEKVNPANKLRDSSPTASMYATSPSGSVVQTPRTSNISIPTFTNNAESSRSNRTYGESSRTYGAGGGSRQGRSLAPQTDELDSYSSGTEKQPEPAQETEPRLMTEEQFKSFLDALQDPENSNSSSALLPDKEDHSQRSEKAHEDSIVNALTQVKQFLGAGSPVRNLRTGLRNSVPPSSRVADRVEMPNSPGPVPSQTPPAQETGGLLGWQTSIPVFCSLPELIDRLFDHLVKTREPPLHEGLTRARWKCRCGVQLFDDFIELVPSSIQELETQIESRDRATQGDSIGAVGGSLGSALNSLVTWVARRLTQLRKPSNMSSGSVIPMHNAGQTPAVATAEEETSHMLLCIDKGNSETKLHQKRIEHISKDRELFVFLRQLYCNYRMPKTWFTLRSIRFLSLSRFTVDLSTSAEVYKHSSVCSPDCFCLPPEAKVGSEYKCSPAPMTKPKQIPPIGQNRLTHYFRSPGCIDEKQATIYDQIPKRICGELKATSKQEEEGWGMHFEEGWHWRTIYIATAVFLFSFSLVFGVVWSVTSRTFKAPSPSLAFGSP